MNTFSGIFLTSVQAIVMTVVVVRQSAGGVAANLISNLSSNSTPALPIPLIAESRRDPRLFSNPFGILGHKKCWTNAGENFETAAGKCVCYNEVECLVNGGRFSAYCSSTPPAISGVCCVFISNKCDGRTTTKRVSYFTNPKYPMHDTEPTSCHYRVEALPGTCWVRFDFEDFELDAQASGKCLLDSMSILNSPDGPGGKICGTKKGYSTVVRIKEGEPLTIGFVLQSPSYKWNIRISQIRCSDVVSMPRTSECGETGAEGFTRIKKMLKIFPAPQMHSPTDSNEQNQIARVRKLIKVRKRVLRETDEDWVKQHESTLKPKPIPLRRKKVRKRRGPLAVEQAVCNNNEYVNVEAACTLIRRAYGREKDNNVEDDRGIRLQTTDLDDDATAPEPPSPGFLTRKQLSNEAFFPAYSTKEVFCRSKFREMSHPSYKIIDGFEAPMHAFPWMASLQIEGLHFCGGNLINKRWVMTAAHCVDFGDIKDFLGMLVVKLAEHDITQADETEIVARRVNNIVINPRYTAWPSAPGDIALLRLSEPVSFTRQVAPVCLPKDDSLTYERLLGVAAGWGVTEDGGLSDVLRQVELNILPNITCTENLNSVNLKTEADHICTFKGPTGSETICSGDSGGPLMVRESNGKFVLVGLSSFSVADCSAPFPAVFTRVTAWLGWIAAVLTD